MSTARKVPKIKPRHAIALTGFDGTPKVFRDRCNKVLGGDKTPEKPYQHRDYTPAEIRLIRLYLLSLAGAVAYPGMPPVINVRMSKGGVGKTTLATNLAVCLAHLGYRCLFIDGDPQSSATDVFGVDWTTQKITHISEVMSRVGKGPSGIQNAIIPIYPDGMLDLVAADITMENENWLLNAMSREYAFQRLLDAETEFFSQYDVIIIDSAPGASFLTTSFMMASKKLLSVVTPEPKPVAALDVLASSIAEINYNFPNRAIGPLGTHVVVNRFDQTKKPHVELLSTIASKCQGMLSDVIVRQHVGFLKENKDDPEHCGPLFENDLGAPGSRDVLDLARELVKVFDIRLAGHQAEAVLGMRIAA
ncbi:MULTISPECIES: ParA family protein [Noviherbaspirillum]|uniref:ParA family protein n=1 Tax=Noviherbaspirillum TaxID=1344552 RepID=UPI00124F2762|nr:MULTISPECIES: ParA family protein [Noviherbaspirillum]